VRDYLRWLRRTATRSPALCFASSPRLEMIEPLFMRHIIDRVLLNTVWTSDAPDQSNLAGAFVSVVILSNLVSALKTTANAS